MNKYVNKIETPASIAIADKVRELASKGIKSARMQTGEPFFDTPTYIIDGAYEAMQKGYTHYSTSQGLPELRKEISLWYQKDYGAEIPLERILITNGAIHALFCILSALVNSGEEVIIPEPFWPQYKYIAFLVGADVKTIDTSKNRGRLNGDLLEKAISTRSKVIIINNPVNPTGVAYSKSDVDDFLKIAVKHNLYIVFDEVYSRITYGDGFSSVFLSGFYEKAKDLVVYVNSFSKTFAMTGWRVGYIISPEGLRDFFLKVSQNSITNVNPFCQYGAKVALEKREENSHVLEEMLSVYKKRFHELHILLEEKKKSFIYPGGAFYFFIDAGTSSKEFALDLLEKEGIAVVPGISYGRHFDTYYRISFAVDDYSYDRFYDWLYCSSTVN